MFEQLEDRLNEVPEDFRQTPVLFAAAALIGPFIIVLLATVAGPSASSPLMTLAAVVFVVAVGAFAPSNQSSPVGVADQPRSDGVDDGDCRPAPRVVARRGGGRRAREARRSPSAGADRRH